MKIRGTISPSGFDFLRLARRLYNLAADVRGRTAPAQRVGRAFRLFPVRV